MKCKQGGYFDHVNSPDDILARIYKMVSVHLCR